MEIQLTPQQQLAVDTAQQGPPRLIDPRTHAAYVLVLEADYEAMREFIDEERQRHGIHTVALQNAAGLMDELP